MVKNDRFSCLGWFPGILRFSTKKIFTEILKVWWNQLLKSFKNDIDIAYEVLRVENQLLRGRNRRWEVCLVLQQEFDLLFQEIKS